MSIKHQGIKSSVRTLARLSSVLVLGTSLSVSAVELITNGSFDTGLGSWTASGVVGKSSTSTVPVPASAISGDSAIFNYGDTGLNATLYQTITTVAGNSYKLQFKHAYNGGISSQKLEVQIGAGTSISTSILNTTVTSNTANTAPQTATFIFVATSASTTINFTDVVSPTNSGNGADILLDDVSVTDYVVPTPIPTGLNFSTQPDTFAIEIEIKQ